MRLIFGFAALALATAASAQTAAPRAGLSEACRTEVTALCPRGEDRAARRQCMMANRDKISTGCKTELQAMRGQRQGGRMGGNGDMSAPGAMTTDPQPK